MSSAIGIEKQAVTLIMGANENAQVAEALSHVLADTSTLYLKTHDFLNVRHFRLRGMAVNAPTEDLLT